MDQYITIRPIIDLFSNFQVGHSSAVFNHFCAYFTISKLYHKDLEKSDFVHYGLNFFLVDK